MTFYQSHVHSNTKVDNFSWFNDRDTAGNCLVPNHENDFAYHLMHQKNGEENTKIKREIFTCTPKTFIRKAILLRLKKTKIPSTNKFQKMRKILNQMKVKRYFKNSHSNSKNHKVKVTKRRLNNYMIE